MSASVLSWGATRSISGNTVTVTVDPSGGLGVFTVEETLVGITVSSKPSSCAFSSSILSCDFESEQSGTIVYVTEGTGSVTGTIDGIVIVDGVSTSSSKDITGDTLLGPAQNLCADVTCNPITETCGDGTSQTCTPTCVATTGVCGTCDPCIGNTGSEDTETLSEKLDTAIKAESISQGIGVTAADVSSTSWTTALISRIAAALKAIFS